MAAILWRYAGHPTAEADAFADEAAISAYARPAVSWARAEKVVDGVGGNQITIYYAQNSWNFTRQGKINDVTAQQLKEILGVGNVSITFSLELPQ